MQPNLPQPISKPHLAAIHRLSSALFAKTDVPALLWETLRVCMETTGADAGSILVHDPEDDSLVFEYVEGPVASNLVGRRLPVSGDSKCAQVFRTGFSDISTSGFDRSIQTGYQTESALTAGIRAFDGACIGVIQVINKIDHAFDQLDREMLEVVCTLAATFIENARRAELEKEAALARVLTYIGHDIKNQAFIIQGSQQTFQPLIEDGLRSLADKGVEGVEEIEAYLSEFLMMISESTTKTLDLATVVNEYGARRNLFDFRVNDLARTLCDEMTQLVLLAGRDGIQVDLSPLGHVPPFPFDAFFISRAVYNLASNAIQAMLISKQGSCLTIGSRYSERDGWVEIMIQDDGPGMSADRLASILSGNATSDKRGGTGVGTRLAHYVVRTHGGELLGESRPGSGTAFRIRLPLTQSNSR